MNFHAGEACKNMSQKRPWKVHFHHDGTKQFSDDESMPDAYVIDTSRPINGTSSHRGEDAADAAARGVSRHGGSARITFRDPKTGIETEIRTYTPYQVVLEDLATVSFTSAGESPPGPGTTAGL